MALLEAIPSATVAPHEPYGTGPMGNAPSLPRSHAAAFQPNHNHTASILAAEGGPPFTVFGHRSRVFYARRVPERDQPATAGGRGPSSADRGTGNSHDDGVVTPDGSVDPAFRQPLSYIDRSRRYYAAKGFAVPYRWATNQGAPFTPPGKPVAQCRLAVVTTSFPPADGDHEHRSRRRPDKSVQVVEADPPPDTMFTDDLFWHKEATHTEDVESFLPLRTLAAHVAGGRLGSLNHRFFCVPTEYSKRATASNAAVIEGWCGDDEVDVVLLVPL